MVLPGMIRLTRAVSWLSSMAEPATRTMLAGDWPPGTYRAGSGRMTNVPPPGSAGVPVRMPATRTETWAGGASEVSCVTPCPRTAAAAGEASTGRGAVTADAPGAVRILAAGKDGDGVLATTAE